MKIYIVNESYTDDDGNLGSEVIAICKTRAEAVKKLKEEHDEVIEYFNNPEDDFECDDLYFDINEADDFGIRREAHIEELDLD